jgi:epoxide hydrolase 4
LKITHQRVNGDGVALHVAHAGSGPPVLLLHGFPDNWTTWAAQVEPLVAAGYSVWMADLRGYNLSDRPAGRAAYRMTHLVADTAALLRATGAGRVHLCGHDWGGVIAWAVAGAHPDLVRKLVIFNAPHPRLYLRRVWRPPQLFRSWYVAFFLLPWLPERALAARDFAAIRRMYGGAAGRPGRFGAEQIEAFIEPLRQPGALTAALNYYRANALSVRRSVRRRGPLRAETLVIWGERDPALTTRLLHGLQAVAPRVRIQRIPDAGHWVQHEAAATANRALIDFLGAAASAD